MKFKDLDLDKMLDNLHMEGEERKMIKEGARVYWGLIAAALPVPKFTAMAFACVKDMMNERKFPNETDMQFFGTLGELRSIKGWWLDEWIVEEITRVSFARFSRFQTLSLGADPMDTVLLIALTNELSEELIKHTARRVLGRLKKKFPGTLDEQAAKAYRELYTHRVRQTMHVESFH